MTWLLTDAELWSATSTLYEKGLCSQPGVNPDRWSPARGVDPKYLRPEKADALCRECKVRATCTEVGLVIKPNPSTVMGGMWGWQLDELRAAIVATDELLTGFTAATRDQVDVVYKRRRAAGWSGQAAFLSALAEVADQSDGDQDSHERDQGERSAA